MASLSFEAEYAEVPLEQHESSVEINKLAARLQIAKKIDVHYSTAEQPKTTLSFSISLFTSGAVKKITRNALELFSSINSVLNFSQKLKRVTFIFEKNWILKGLSSTIREYYQNLDPGEQYFLSQTRGVYTLCKVNQVLNYYEELIGPDYTKLLKCYEKKDDYVLAPVNQRYLELLRLVAPVREIDKDTAFMSQVAPLTGVLDGDPEDGDKTTLLEVRDELLGLGMIQKIEDNYEVTEAFKNVDIYSVTDLVS
ncbi:hypothetical protein ACFL27_15570 [candidate division CSSED10-310 bacterium]|uniref:Uncharacterized protein n=1 Tax=candidate division CSSED10-310 bacterium TaxID=2855610 RepID=A0ABV6YZK0_UNCC1